MQNGEWREIMWPKCKMISEKYKVCRMNFPITFVKALLIRFSAEANESNTFFQFSQFHMIIFRLIFQHMFPVPFCVDHS